jgi:hypothetical protein
MDEDAQFVAARIGLHRRDNPATPRIHAECWQVSRIFSLVAHGLIGSTEVRNSFVA